MDALFDGSHGYLLVAHSFLLTAQLVKYLRVLSSKPSNKIYLLDIPAGERGFFSILE